MEETSENSKPEPGFTIEPHDEGHMLLVPKNGGIPTIVTIGSLNLPPVHADITPEKEPTRRSLLSKVTHAIVSRLDTGEY